MRVINDKWQLIGVEIMWSSQSLCPFIPQEPQIIKTKRVNIIFKTFQCNMCGLRGRALQLHEAWSIYSRQKQHAKKSTYKIIHWKVSSSSSRLKSWRAAVNYTAAHSSPVREVNPLSSHSRSRYCSPIISLWDSISTGISF